ncbi:ABC transporter ATP-binding protein [Pseudonocardia hispaniensis]|uniref:ABC transporter ATP-binding protein n=1 Tax=Pseudonocardia hispaniensis TaxID=904933 RepID=A0ABW1J308_9PSEU
MAVLEVRDVTKRFSAHGGVLAVDHIDFTTEDGEFLVLLGPSGCGKTTLLRMIAGLEQPSSGEIYIGGDPMTGLPPRLRKIAMVFQTYALYPHKSIRDNIDFPLRAERLDKQERRTKVEWAAGLLGIGHLLGRKPRELSGGERQRVALARALVRAPTVFLLDEPLSNLDAKLRTSAREELKDFHRRVGTTTVYVTHDQVEAMGMGHRIAVLSEGRLRQLATPEQIYHHPADTFVATFVGSPPMNLVTRSDHLLGFRPERFLPRVAVPQRPGDLVTPFEVQLVENLGAERHLVGVAPQLGDQVRIRSVLPSTVDTGVQAGERHEFVVRAADLRYFDADTGLRTEARRESVRGASR